MGPMDFSLARVYTVLIGPIDMGYLIYNPRYRFLGGADHYVLIYGFDDKNIYYTVSIGICTARNEEKGQDILKKADEALYYAKNHGKDKYVFYSDII